MRKNLLRVFWARFSHSYERVRGKYGFSAFILNQTYTQKLAEWMERTSVFDEVVELLNQPVLNPTLLLDLHLCEIMFPYVQASLNQSFLLTTKQEFSN